MEFQWRIQIDNARWDLSKHHEKIFQIQFDEFFLRKNLHIEFSERVSFIFSFR